MKTSDFDYVLPPEMIAQRPIEPRDSSRLLVLERSTGEMAHRHFRDLVDYLRPGDLLVANDSRVIPARLFGRKESGGRAEVFLVRQVDDRTWQALVRGKRLRPGTGLLIEPVGAGTPSTTPFAPKPPLVRATIVDETADGGRVIEFDRAIAPILADLGVVPLPPYIHEPLSDPERYQTVYARVSGSVAAPTAGLHFTPHLIDLLADQGVAFAFVTLHVGLDTFRPVQTEALEDHPMHSEWSELPEPTAEAVALTHNRGGRVIAVGTTAVRVLEAAAAVATHRNAQAPTIPPFRGWTSIYIYPGYRFKAVDAMITNFHLPRSTLLMLVAAFAGKARIDAAYRAATAKGYRFYSFGDAMFIV